MIGPSVFGNPEATMDASSNRALLLEFCVATGMQISSTFGSRSVEEQVTFYSLASQRTSEISWRNFAQLDNILSQISNGPVCGIAVV